MKMKIYYLVNEDEGYQIESFNNDIFDIKIISDFDEIAVNAYRGTIDVILIDDGFINDVIPMINFLADNSQKIKIYFMLNTFSLESIQWAIDQPWIDKIIPTTEPGMVLTDSLVKTITKDTQLMMENKQLAQENKELEFVISQMMLVD